MENLLVRIRNQANSGLENQRNAAVLLKAVEETIQEQGSPLVPISYFGTLMTIIEEAPEDDDSVITAATYLLSIIFPSMPSAVLKVKFGDIADLFQRLIQAFEDNAPIVRALAGCFEILLAAQDNLTWKQNPLCAGIFQDLLALCLDPRPKVRKRATEAVKKILISPPAPALAHPFTTFSIVYSLEILNVEEGPISKEAQSNISDNLVFLKMLIPVYGKQSSNEKVAQKLSELCAALLSLPLKFSGSNTVINQWVFSIISSLLSAENEDSLEFNVVLSIVTSLIELSPFENDPVLTPAWLEAITYGFGKLSEFVCEYEVHGNGNYTPEFKEFATKEYSPLVSTFFQKSFKTFLASDNNIRESIRVAATSLFEVLSRQCISNSMIETSARGSTDLKNMIESISEGLGSIHFRDQWGYILTVAAGLIWRVGSSDINLILPILNIVMKYRDDKSYNASFPFKEELDLVLKACVVSLGIEQFCGAVPLNISTENSAGPKRPYLLSLFGDALKEMWVASPWYPLQVLGNQGLGFFAKELVPLAAIMLEKAGAAWRDQKQVEAKVYETLGVQIWELFPKLCASLPSDTAKSFPVLAPHLGRVLTTDPNTLYPDLPSSYDFRPVVCRGLDSLIEDFVKLSNFVSDDESEKEYGELCKKEGTLAISKMRSYVNRFLSALCNIYITVDPARLGKSKGQALQSLNEKSIQFYEKPIRQLLNIADKKAISEYMGTIIQKQLENSKLEKKNQLQYMAMYAMIDLTVMLALNVDSIGETLGIATQFYGICLMNIRSNDGTLQKKSYKALSSLVRLLPSETLNINQLVELLLEEEVISVVASGATKPRIILIQNIAQIITERKLLLHFIPQILPEVMLATKEANEKTRDIAYDCLISMANMMMKGGSVSEDGETAGVSKVNRDTNSTELDFDDENYVGEVSVKEFLMMVLAGLAGSSSHMQSAAVASLGRLLFEFSNQLDAETIDELVKTVILTMTFKNREVTKAALGFLKVSVLCLPSELLEKHLQEIIESILATSRDHKSHFKSKVRHLFERLIRKFSFEAIDNHIPTSDKKLILNIKKRKENLKRRKAAENAEKVVDMDNNIEKVSANKLKFEDALQDSESDLDSDDDQYIPDEYRKSKSDKKTLQSQTVIREGDVVDFLDRNVVSKLTNKRKSSKTPQSNFEYNKDGRMIVDDSESEKEEAPEISEDYYKQSLSSEVAFTRRPDGRIKFLNKRKRENDNDEVGEAVSGKRWNSGKQKAPKEDEGEVSKMLGRQYKAKRAGGDVKRPGQVDPYAYIPLNTKIVGNMKKSTKIDGKLKNILKAAHKGSEIGQKQRKLKGIPKGNKKHRK